MWINTPNARLAVGGRRGLRLNAGRGTTLKAVRGTLWVTIDNDPRDIVLDPGESFLVDSDAPLFVMALGDNATLDVCAESAANDRRSAAPRAWSLWPRRAQEAIAQVALRGTAAAA
jgi:hypothetical protein